MGAGNFCVRDHNGNECPMVYIEEPDDESDFISELVDDIRAILPESFYVNDDYKGNDRAMHIVNIGENGLLSVDLFGTYNENIAVVVQVRDEHVQNYPDVTQTLKLAESYMAKFAPNLFDKLADMYELRIRCGAWISGKYKKRQNQTR